jgi:hypothetical protein
MHRLRFPTRRAPATTPGLFHCLLFVRMYEQHSHCLQQANGRVAARRRSLSWPRLAVGHQRLAHTWGGSSCRETTFSISAAKSSYYTAISRTIRRASASRMVSARTRVSWALLRHWEGLSRVRCAGHGQPFLVSSPTTDRIIATQEAVAHSRALIADIDALVAELTRTLALRSQPSLSQRQRYTRGF